LPELNRILADNLAVAFGVVVVLLLIILLLLIVQSLRLGRAVAAYRKLLGQTDGRGGSLSEVLDAHVAQVDTVSHRLDELNRLHAYLEARSRGSLQHIGMVRFNPFEDTGSDQSFAIALLDDRRDGVVLSSLHGRANTRLFAKPVEDGSSKHTLSAEEAEAIRIAVEGTGPIPTVG
jgi:predicted phosphohydrolase